MIILKIFDKILFLLNSRQISCLCFFFIIINVNRGQTKIDPVDSDQSELTKITKKKEKANVQYFTVKNKAKLVSFQDTSLSDFEKYAPNRKIENAALNLGNLGSSNLPVIYNSRQEIFTDIGFHQYDIFKLDYKDFRFYKLNRAYNDLSFSPLAGQQNFIVSAKFSRNFSDDINLAIDYERIKQIGFYTHQGTKSTKFGIGIWKKGKKENHNLYMAIIANNFNEQHNGGASTEINGNPLYDDPLYRSQRTSIPTFVNDGNSRHEQFSYIIENTFDFLNKFEARHVAQYDHGYYRYGDSEVSSLNDSLLYLNYLTDNIGLRFVNKFSRLSQVFDLGLKSKNVNLNFGLIYKWLNFDDSNNSQSFHDLGIFGRFGGNLKNVGDIVVYSEIGVGKNAGNLLLSGKVQYNSLSFLQLSGFLNISRYDPSLLQKKAYVTGVNVYNNDFTKINEIAIGGQINIPKLNLNLKATSGVLDNAIYNNQLAIPEQNDDAIDYVQLQIKHTLFWKFIGLENEGVYQKFNRNVFLVPEIYSIHNIYLQSRLFKKNLLGRLGILYYNMDIKEAAAFQPLTGQFYPSDRTIEKYHYSELYATFQVKQFRIFFKYDNFTDLFQKKVHYQILNYPQFDGKFRMGVRWLIND